MDLLFFGDSAGTSEEYGGDHHAAVRYGVKWPWHDMMPMIPCMARVASGVGFGITMSTTFHHPFYIARIFNALDHVTQGRIAWNAVTSRSKNEAANWGYDKLIEHDARYEQAQEHLHVVRALWDSVERDAIIFDRATGIFADPEKVHVLDFRGRFYNVRGPLPSLPSPQGRPVIIQAGQSAPGMELAAIYADMQFSTRRTIPSMKEHRTNLDAKLVQFGRKPRDCGILWSVRVQVAESESEARDKERQYLDSIPPEAGLIELSAMYGLDFSLLRREMRLVDVADEVKSQNAHWGSFEEILKTTDPNLTVEQFGRKFMTDRVLVAAGTPKMIADRLEQLHFETGANGGFMLARGFSAPGNLQEFVDLVVPELQRRGLSKARYSGATLRDNLLN
jgi:FMN-dependent oxidoreductase (nitrilotriacetate monooxygenase family)